MVKADKSLWIWGGNANGRLGIGAVEEGEAEKYFSPVKIMDNVDKVSLARLQKGEVQEITAGGPIDKGKLRILK